MYKHILIAIDGSEVGSKALNHGLSLAKTVGATVTVITVTEHFPIDLGGAYAFVPTASTMDEYRTSQSNMANALLADAKEAADSLGVTIETLHVPDSLPGGAILDTAKSRDCDLIAMGSHGRRGISRILLGSKASEVVTHSHVPVLVVR